MSTTLPLVEGADGLTLLSNWLVVIREDADFAESALAGRVKDKRRARNLELTQAHEAIHFLQGFTAAFPYSYSVSLLRFCNRLMNTSREGQLNAARLQAYRDEYAELGSTFESPYGGLSTIDLMEAMAVTESFRATSPEVTPSTFSQYLEEAFPDPASSYRKALSVVISKFGPEIALETTSRLCFLALNGDTPAQSFSIFLRRLGDANRASIKYMSAADLAALFSLDPRASLLSNYGLAVEKGGEHAILMPYLRRLEKIAALPQRFEFAARPGDWLRRGPSGVEDIVPPLFLYSGGRGLKMGLAKQWSREELFMYFDTGALVGACQCLVGTIHPYVVCPLTDCPVHKTAMCHSWFAVPHDNNWSTCAFPKRLTLHFQKTPQDLTALKVQATAVATSSTTRPTAGYKSPLIGRSIEEYRKLLNEAAQLDNSEEWDRRVIALLSEAEVNNLQHALTDNAGYLVMSVAGYLADMAGQLPFNCYQEWMNGTQPRLSDDYFVMLLKLAMKLGAAISPWFGLTLLRALQTIIEVPRGIASRPSSAPGWLKSQMREFAAQTGTGVPPVNAPAIAGRPLSPIGGTPTQSIHTFRAEHRDIASSNVTGFDNFVRLLSAGSGPAPLHNSVVLLFHGYDADPRHVYDIPEVRKYMTALKKIHPELFFLLNLDDGDYGQVGTFLPFFVGYSRERTDSGALALQFDMDSLERFVRSEATALQGFLIQHRIGNATNIVEGIIMRIYETLGLV
jgi:hypothetical protein